MQWRTTHAVAADAADEEAEAISEHLTTAQHAVDDNPGARHEISRERDRERLLTKAHAQHACLNDVTFGNDLKKIVVVRRK